jgi:hypothetical protein
VIQLNKKDLQLLAGRMSLEQDELKDEILEYDNAPDEMLSEFVSLGRLRVWACEQLEVIHE